MNYQEAKNEIPNTETFCRHACDRCNNDWYCPSDCDLLSKAKRIPFYRILNCYARHDGDMAKVFRYIKSTKERLYVKNDKRGTKSGTI